jgi:hypothetical protein
LEVSIGNLVHWKVKASQQIHWAPRPTKVERHRSEHPYVVWPTVGEEISERWMVNLDWASPSSCLLDVLHQVTCQVAALAISRHQRGHVFLICAPSIESLRGQMEQRFGDRRRQQKHAGQFAESGEERVVVDGGGLIHAH